MTVTQTASGPAEIERQALDLAPVMVRDLDGRIRLWTGGMERLYGFSRSEAVGRLSHRLLETVFPRPLDEIDGELLARGVWAGELVHRRRDGTSVTVASSWSVMRDGDGRPQAVTEVSNDITQQKRDEAARLHLAAIVESSQDAIVSKTLDGVITSWNKAAETLFGYAPDEIVGGPIGVLFPPELIDEEEVILAKMRRGEQIAHYETLRRRKDGSDLQVSLTVSPIRDASGRIIGVSKVLRDITEQRRALARVQDLQSELVHMSRLTTMGQMASTLAHELNQPLTAVINYLSALRRMNAGQPPDPWRVGEIVDKAVEQAARAGQVIRHLRDFVAKGDTERRLEEINQVIADATSLALIGAKQQGVVPALALDPAVPEALVDRVQIQQVIVNLVRNAVEAMEGGERRELLVSTRFDRAAGMAEIAVADTGPGISPDVAERLFQPFASTKKSGLGLGLSICREIVEAHGGRLSVAPNPPRGAVFTMTLPVVAEEEGAGGAEPEGLT